MYLRAMAVFPLAILCLLAQTPSNSGIHVENLDRSCKPCDDFWRFANGTWIDKNPIPAAFQSWGPSQIMAKANRERLQTILETARAQRSSLPGSTQRQLGDFYASCMDTAVIDARGITPVKSDFDRIDAIRTRSDLVAALVHLQSASRPYLSNNGQVIGLFRLTSGIDPKDPSRVTARLVERDNAGRTPSSIFSMPDRDYYLNTDAKSQEIRQQLLQHVAKLLTLSGIVADTATLQARKVLDFETAIAGSVLKNADRRDPERTYHLMDLAELRALAPNFDWRLILREAGLPESAPVNVAEPDLLKKANQQLAEVALDDWKIWLRWRALKLASPYLAKPFADEDFHFERTVLRGIAEPPARWETCAQIIDRDLPDPLGEAYIAKYFPPESKARMSQLVENIRAAMREELQKSDWMQPETKSRAIEKLDALKVQIGYPDKWGDYSKLNIDRARFYENVRNAWEHGQVYEWSKIGKPVSYTDWAMTAPTVNAYSSSVEVKIVFPAGYLQPPDFDPTGDDAANYAGIGTTIGHEMGHQFDDGGSKFDANGRLRNWWTAQDRELFDQRASCVVDQFNSIDVGDGLRHNGKLVLGEALGDLGGAIIAYRAYRRSLDGKPEQTIDGYTPDQRFFIAFAQKWGSQSRPEAMRLMLATDNHPLWKYRANATLANMPEFQKAFRCVRGDAMMRPPDRQCHLW